MSKPYFEMMQRDGFCRSCDKEMKRGVDYAVKLYSWRNRGQSILICPECVTEMYSLLPKPSEGILR